MGGVVVPVHVGHIGRHVRNDVFEVHHSENVRNLVLDVIRKEQVSDPWTTESMNLSNHTVDASDLETCDHGQGTS